MSTKGLKQVIVYLPPEIHAKLSATAKEWNKPLSQYVREEVVRAVQQANTAGMPQGSPFRKGGVE